MKKQPIEISKLIFSSILRVVKSICAALLILFKKSYQLFTAFGLKTKIALSAVFLSFVIYTFCNYFIYCNLAFMHAPLVAVAPEVKGYIKEIYIMNNQFVQQGDKIIQIDPLPYALEVDTLKAELESARIELKILTEEKEEALVTKDSYVSQADLASKKLDRYKSLLPQGFVSKESVDELTNSQIIADVSLARAVDQIQQSSLNIKKQTSVIKMLEAKLAVAEYNLSRTTIYAATTGYINNFNLSIGQYLEQGQSICGLIGHKDWQVIAEYQESDLAHIYIGQKILFYVPNYPWKIWTGRVKSIGHGVARTAVVPNAAMPYVEPVTDWIRYPYRFKVYISIDELPPANQLFMGMSVYTLALP